VKDVGELATHSIDLSKLDRDTRLEVPLQKPNLPFLFVDEERVAVEVRVVARRGRITIVPPTEVAVRNCPEDKACYVEPDKVTVTLTGPKPVLAKVKDRELPLELYVDALDYDPRQSKHEQVRPNCDRPSGVDCAMTPRTLSLFILSPEDMAKKAAVKGK